MARCVKICPTNVLNGVTLYSTNTASSTTIQRLKRSYRGAYHIQGWSSSVTMIYGSGSASLTADTFALMRHRLPAGATVTLRLYDSEFAQGTAPSGTTAYTSAALSANTAAVPILGENDWILNLGSAITFKSFSLTIAGLPSTGTAAMFAIYFGLSMSMSKGFGLDARFQQIRPPELGQTVSGGNVIKRPAVLSRSMVMPFGFLSAADRAALSAAERDYCASAWLLFGYPDGDGYQKAEYSFIGVIDGAMSYGRTGNGVYHNATLVLREI